MAENLTKRRALDNGRTDWERRYREGDTGWDQGRPVPAVEEAAGFFGPGSRVLVPGCGHGHDAARLAEKGFRVEGWDVAPSAIGRARAWYGGAGVVFREADLLADLPERGGFDGLFEHTLLCAVGPEHYEAVARRYAELLGPGGLLFAVLFTGLEEADPPPWRIDASRAEELFSRRFEILGVDRPVDAFPHREGEETVWRLRRSARVPGDGR